MLYINTMDLFRTRTETGLKNTNIATTPLLTCPKGYYVDEIKGRSGYYVDQIGMVCNDLQKTILGPVGNNQGGSPFSTKNSDGWQTVPTSSGAVVDNIMGYGGHGANQITMRCPGSSNTNPYYDALKINGFSAQHSDFNGAHVVNWMNISCGYDKNKWCIDNLEDPSCKDVSANILNQACAKNMTTTCKDRRKELVNSTVTPYCAEHMSDPFCSCYKEPPDILKGKVGQNSQCWNGECANKGYILNDTPCSPVQVCIQNFANIAGANNILTNNIVNQCENKAPQQPLQAITSPITDVSSTLVDKIMANKKYVILLLVLFLVLIVVQFDFDDSDNYKQRPRNAQT